MSTGTLVPFGVLSDHTLTRYRLRFLLQEIDLPQGDTLIGRSAACHVSIEDPLVSRQHARLRIEGEQATIEDLGSRNGLQVGGHTIQGTHELFDGDRIRIGTQELVFCTVSVPSQRGRGPTTRPTGFMTHCADCELPYPAELIECPNCGSTAREEDNTLSGVGQSQRNWTLELLIEVLLKARSLGRADDVERVLRRAGANIDECLALGRPLEKGTLDIVADATFWLADQTGDATWAAWSLKVYASLALVPGGEVLERLRNSPPARRQELQEAASELAAAVRARGGPSEEERRVFEQLDPETRSSEG